MRSTAENTILFFSLFGSILTPNFNTSSDIDVLVTFDENHTLSLFDIVDMEFELSSITGRTIDLKTPEDLSLLFRNDVVAEAETLYTRSI